MTGVAVEAEKQRPRIDPHFLHRDVELVILLLLLQWKNLFGPRCVNVDLSRQVAQIGGVRVLHDRYVLPVQTRQLPAVLVLHPEVVVAKVVDHLALCVSRHLVRPVANQLVRRSVDTPHVIVISVLPLPFQDVRRHHRNADRVEQRRKRLGQVHHYGVIVGGLGLDALLVDRDRRSNAIGHLRVVNDIQREQYIVRRHRLTIEPFHIVTKMERDRLTVCCDVPTFGQAPFRQSRDRIELEQRLEQVRGERARRGVSDQNRIKGAGIAADRRI